MLAVGLIGRSGRYYRNSKTGSTYIKLARGNEMLPVKFIAYCVDFDKPNPSVK